MIRATVNRYHYTGRGAAAIEFRHALEASMADPGEIAPRPTVSRVGRVSADPFLRDVARNHRDWRRRARRERWLRALAVALAGVILWAAVALLVEVVS